MDAIISALNNVDLEMIVKWYGYFMLWILPLLFMIVFVSYLKKPNSLMGLTKLVTKIVEERMAKKMPIVEIPKKTKSNEKQENEDKAKKEKPEVLKQDEQEKKQIVLPELKLYIKDKYFCSLSSLQKQNNNGSYYDWSSSNPFVAEIFKNSNIIIAKRVGECVIRCNNEDIYRVVVLPKKTEWFASDMLRAILFDTADRKNVRRIIMDPDIRGLFHEIKNWTNPIYTKMTTYGSIKLAFDTKGKIEQCVFSITGDKERNEKYFNIISTNVSEYMEEFTDVKNLTEQLRCEHLWIHITKKESEFVDYVSFVMKVNDNYVFAIGRYWRENATRHEVLNNPELIVRMFSRLFELEPDSIQIGQTLDEKIIAKQREEEKKEKADEEKDNARNTANIQDNTESSKNNKENADTEWACSPNDEEVHKDDEKTETEEDNENTGEIEVVHMEDGDEEDDEDEGYNHEPDDESNLIDEI